MKLINSLQELIDNALYLSQQLNSNKESNKYVANELIKRGMNFLKYTVDGKTLFAPCRFIGYQNNTIKKHTSEKLNGSTTKQRINKLLKLQSQYDADIDKLYIGFCEAFDIVPYAIGSFGEPRKYWDLDNIQTDVYGNLEFEEGKKKYRLHLTRERNPILRREAIANFIIDNGSVYCEACEFNFEKKYGEHGKDFIECHHTIPLSKMKAGHKSKYSDLVLLCSNCHRMVHKNNSKWLTIAELKEIIDNDSFGFKEVF
jgi:predicted HNH restriction endonuclease